MQFNFSSVVLAALVVSVAARPSPDAETKAVRTARHMGAGVFGQLFRRADKDEEEESKDEESKDAESKDAESKDEESKDEEETKATTPKKTKAAGAAATATGSASAPKTTGGSKSGSGSSSGTGTSGGSIPDAAGTSVLSAAQTIAAGESFDGGMVMFDRGMDCTGQVEGGEADTVFRIENGGSLSNVIIGPNQLEGIHCFGSCTLTNVWWSAVCEDAFTIKTQEAGETTKISGGGAFGAADKVMQHNGAGTLEISGFNVEDFGKLYRSCGNCATSYERHVIISDVTASNGDLIAGINSNFGDTAIISGVSATGVKNVCERFEGVEKGSEPKSIGTGADGTSCIIN